MNRWITEKGEKRGGGMGYYARISGTYPAVPRVPKIGHGNIETDTKGEGSSKDGGHIDTCEVGPE